MPPKPRPIEERFWSKVDKRGPDECWPWTGCLSSNGYGSIRRAAGKAESTHVLSFKIHHGEVSSGAYVLHSCDRRECVNPAHLRLGTHAENMLDMSRRGRSGSACKLTRAQVDEILASKEIGRVLAARFGVSKAAVWDVRRGTTWNNPSATARV